MNDEIDFSSLEPEDFNTTAVEVKAFANPPMNAPAFAARVAELVAETRRTYERDGEGMDPITVVAGPRGIRRYTPTDEENNEEYYTRVGTEAQRWGATFFFVALQTPSVVYQHEMPMLEIDKTDSKRLRAALEEQMLSIHVAWYARLAQPDLELADAGVLVTSGGRTGNNIPSDPHEHADFIRTVLGEVGDVG